MAQQFDLPNGADVSGKASLLLTAFLFVIDKIGIAHINQWFVLCTSFVGFVYISMKTYLFYDEFCEKRKEIKKRKRNNIK